MIKGLFEIMHHFISSVMTGLVFDKSLHSYTSLKSFTEQAIYSNEYFGIAKCHYFIVLTSTPIKVIRPTYCGKITATDRNDSSW